MSSINGPASGCRSAAKSAKKAEYNARRILQEESMNSLRRTLFSLSVFALVPAALAQTLPNLALARLQYTVRKRTTNMQGDLKDKIDANDKALNEATRIGNAGEVRRLLLKGMTLLSGNAWTDVLDYGGSLALRSERVFVDTSKPYAVRLEQIYTPAIALEKSLTAHVTLRKPPAGRGGAPAEVIKDFGTFDEVSRDLRESPYLIELDLASVPDGYYMLNAEVLDGARSLGSASMRIVARKGLDASLAQLESAAQSAPESLKADVLYPVDYIHNVNRGRIDIGQFDVSKELADAADVAKSAKDPFA